MVLIDAHSDASQVFDSDAVRQKVIRSATDNELGMLERRWRSEGVIQSFNWIEPLMPHPIAHVVWIPGERLTNQELSLKRIEVVEQLNAHEMAVPRQAGDLSPFYEVTDFSRFLSRPPTGPVIVSLDLDSFAYESDPGPRLERILDAALELPNLRAITVAISRPYLASEEESHRLLYLTLSYLTRLVNIDLQYEPYAWTGEDRSEKARELALQGKDVPHYAVDQAPGYLRALLVQSSPRIQTYLDRPRWEGLLQSWSASLPSIRLEGSGYVSVDDPLRVRLEGLSDGQIAWKVLLSASHRYNVTGARQGYADGAGAFLLWREVRIATGDGRLEITERDLIPYFDTSTGLGTLRVFCEVDGCRSNVVCISRYQGSGYLARLSEIFNLPYVYGSGLLTVEGKLSADARYGADCAHFLIYGWRRTGRNVPYLNPEQLLPYLREVDEIVGFRQGIAWGARGPLQASPEHVRKGLIMHFGKHAAAICESGMVTERTRVVHQLEGFPSFTTVGELVRQYPQARLMILK